MNSDQSLSKILYKNLVGGKNFYSHTDFTTSEPIKIDDSQLNKLGLTIPIYCNPADRCIYSGININPSSLNFSKPITKEIVYQSDYLLAQPLKIFLKASNKKVVNRSIIVSLTPDIHKNIANVLESSKIIFFNSPSIFTQLANLKFSPENVKHQLIESCFKRLEALIPKSQDLSVTLLSSSQAIHSAEIFKYQQVDVIFNVVEIDSWINKNIAKKDLSDDEISKLINSYNSILKNIDHLSQQNKSQIVLASNKFDIKINDSLTLNIDQSKTHDQSIKTLDKILIKKIKKIWREKTPAVLLKKFDF